MSLAREDGLGKEEIAGVKDTQESGGDASEQMGSDEPL